MKRLILFLFGVNLLFSSLLLAETEPTSLVLPRNINALRNIRVALSRGKTSARIEMDAPYQIETIQTGEVLGRRDGGLLEVTPIRNGLRIGDQEIKIYGVKLVSTFGSIVLGEQRFLDQLQIIREAKGTLTLVNEIDIEVYLRGVLPKEVPTNWPREALKAQAVAARTYALFEELFGFDSDFSLTHTVESQVYGGESSAQPSTSEAIRDTYGEVILYDRELLRTYFHSNCGGRTYKAEWVWDVEPNRALRGIICPYGRSAPSFYWQVSISGGEIAQKLRAAGFNLDRVLDLQPQEQDSLGRAKRIWIRHGDGDMTVNANEFRLAVGAAELKSANFEVDNFGGSFEFKGQGFGHGVGLCQWGMKEMAEEGKNYREILEFYYPGAKVRKIF